MHTQEILQLLDDHDISYQVFSHPAKLSNLLCK